MRIRKNNVFAGWTWRRLALTMGGVGIAATAFYWGRCGTVAEVNAAPQAQAAVSQPAATTVPQQPAMDPAEYAARPVASINGNTLVTRQQFGEYLIARQPDRLENFVNKLIIEDACKKYGLDVTQAEIEASFQEDMKKINVNQREFVSVVLKRYSKTLYEWKEDVIRPRILMTKLCQSQVKIEPEDLRKAYDSAYGEKVICRMIMWPKAESNRVINSVFPKIRDDEKEFDLAAMHQASPTLAANAGKLAKPITHNSTGNEMLERAAFNLRDGEMSALMEWNDQIFVVKCERHLPPDTSVKMEDVRPELERQILGAKVQMMIPEIFQKLKKEADPRYFITMRLTEEELLKRAEDALGAGTKEQPATPAHGN